MNSFFVRFVKLRYDLGKGVGEAKSNSTVILDMWHSVTVSRNAKNASLSLDGNPPVSVVSPGTAVALDVNSNFFLGGVRKLSTVNPNAVDNDPASIQDFSGCINQLEVCKITLQSLYLWYPVPGSKILVRSFPFPRSWASYFYSCNLCPYYLRGWHRPYLWLNGTCNICVCFNNKEFKQ